METKYNEIFKFLCFGEYPSGFKKTQRQNFRKISAKFTLKDGELFVGKRRFIKSEEEAKMIFVEFHALPIGGHKGINRTRSAISARFFWHGMVIDIAKWVQECKQCQKPGKPKSAPQPLQCIKVSAVWELVGIDLTGPFPKTVDGFQYILTATDYFSKWVEAFPLRTKGAAEVGRHICSMIYRHGCPKRFLSDQGREFVDQLNDQMCSLLGIERSVTAAYYPQTNSLDEKTNRNIKRALTKLVIDKQDNWDVHLDATLFSIRSKVHTTTKFSPFLLMYGREAVFPAEVPVELPSTDQQKEFEEEIDFDSDSEYFPIIEPFTSSQEEQDEEDMAVSETNTATILPTTGFQALLGRLKSMVSEENRLNPWCFMNDPKWGPDKDAPGPLEDTEGRLKGTQWCQCGNCKKMSSLEESICCHEFRSMDCTREGLRCVIEHEGFKNKIHSRDVLIEILQASTQMTQQEFERIENRCLRWACYRKFTNLVHGFLGKGHRIPLPSCVVSKIRELYPDCEGNYTEFRWYSEYATGDLQTHLNF